MRSGSGGSTCSASRSAASSPRRWRWCARGCLRRIVLAGTAPRGRPGDPPLVRRRLRPRRPGRAGRRTASSACSSPARRRAEPRACGFLEWMSARTDRPRRADRPGRPRRPARGVRALGDPGPVTARAARGDHPPDGSSPGGDNDTMMITENSSPPRPPPAQRATAHRPGFRPRVPRPVPRAVRRPGPRDPQRWLRARARESTSSAPPRGMTDDAFRALTPPRSPPWSPWGRVVQCWPGTTSTGRGRRVPLYVVLSGRVEVSQRGRRERPIATPAPEASRRAEPDHRPAGVPVGPSRRDRRVLVVPTDALRRVIATQPQLSEQSWPPSWPAERLS